MHECAQHHVFQHGQTGEGLYDLKCASDAEARGAIRRHSGNVFSLKANDAFIRMKKSADQVEDRCFTRAVRADDEKDLARVHRK